MYYNPSEWTMDARKLDVPSNAPIGIPRGQICVSLTDGKLHIPGPPIEINHPQEYNSLNYRCNNGVETMKYGVAGVRNVTTSAWVTQYITEVDELGTGISFSAGVSKGDLCMVYYYARPSWSGGKKRTPVQGDLWLPELSDILFRKANDSQPMRFGYLTNCDGNTFTYSPDMMYNTAVYVGAAGWTTLLDYSGTGTFRNSDFPVYISEIAIHFSLSGWPSYINVKITIDGEEIFREFAGSFGGYTDYAKYIDLDPTQYPESGGPYTETPGNLSSSDDRQMFFDVYETSGGKKAFRFPIEVEALSDVKVEVEPDGVHDLTAVECYIRGYYIE